MVKAKSRVSGVVLVVRFSRWLEGHDLTAAEVDERRVQEFLAAQRSAGRYTSQWSRVGLLCLLQVLREQGAAPPCSPTAFGSATQVLLGSFERYLLDERGLAAGTVSGYVAHARWFLDWLAPQDLSGLTAGEVTAAVVFQAGHGEAVSTVQNFVAGLRAFLRFCFLQGLLDTELSEAALAVTGRRRSALPQGISAVQGRALRSPGTVPGQQPRDPQEPARRDPLAVRLPRAAPSRARRQHQRASRSHPSAPSDSS